MSAEDLRFQSVFPSSAFPSSPSADSTANFSLPTPPSRRKEQRISVSSDDDHFDFNDRCCFGLLNILTVLQLVALLNFLLEALCTYLSLEHVATYAFAISSTTSLLCVCAVISGIQEEKKWMIRCTMAYVVVKLIVIVALYLTGFAAAVEFYVTDEHFSLSYQLRALFMVVPVLVASLVIQWTLSTRVINFIALRDDLYIIPSAAGSVRMRGSLRRAFDAQKSQRSSRY
ncbi:hypothetical protein AAVH_24963 [Aphelenchoides avenae]|nr:hypothetical protein AAVH_24963 [Aphelenchus avenae]